MLWLSWNSFMIPDNCGVSSVRVHTYFGRFFSRYDENLIPGSKTMITNPSDLVSAIESEDTTTLNCCTYWQNDASSPVLCPLNSVRGYWRLLESNSLSLLASPSQNLPRSWLCLMMLVICASELCSVDFGTPSSSIGLLKNFRAFGNNSCRSPPLRISKSIYGSSITVASYFERYVHTRRLG